jgi:hypothetical protein
MAKKEREELRVSRQRAREEFRAILDHWADDGELDPDITFRQIASVCCKMHFWSIVDLEDLDEVFQEFIGSYQVNQKHQIREKYYERKRELLREFHDRWGGGPFIPTWKDAVIFLSQRESFFTNLDDLDRFEVFEDFVLDMLEKKKEDKRKSDRRDGRKRREAFIALLESYKGMIIDQDREPMRWDDFQAIVREDRAYSDLIGTRSSSQPYDLFNEFRSKWRAEGPRKRSNSESSRSSDKKRPK